MTSANRLPLSFSIALTLLLSACGESENGQRFVLGVSNTNTSKVSFGITDAPVDNAKAVVLQVDSITFKRNGSDDVVVNTFTSTDLNITDAETFSIDLLNYQNGNQAIVIKDLELTTGSYSDMVLKILDDTTEQSYVTEKTDTRRALKIAADTLSLGEFSVSNEDEQTLTVDFALRQALSFQSGNNEYRLSANGVRIQNNAGDRAISGEVNTSLFDTVSPCNNKTTPTAGNVVYLYQGSNLNKDNLADSFDRSNSSTTVPSAAIAPFAVAGVQQSGSVWRYNFSFLPAGEYTLVFSCNAADDNPINYDDISLPLPTEQLIEVNTTANGVTCNLPIENNECG